MRLLPPPQNRGATGNCALRKICLLHLQPEITSKAVKIHGKNMWILVSVRKVLEKTWHFSLGFYFGVLQQQPSVLITALPEAPELAGRTLSCLWVLWHYPPPSLPCTDPMEPGPRCRKPTVHQQAKEWSLAPRAPCVPLAMPVWIRLISKVIQVRHGSPHLQAQRAGADTAGNACSPPTYWASVEVFLCTTPDRNKGNKWNGFAEIYGDFLMQKVEHRRKCKG